ncbi:MAG TPA: hypothetical protein VNV61_02775 [Steroidobacteraceae bacterium]|nr:hypothetical protein [Steroidobacteraceae bacterium]
MNLIGIALDRIGTAPDEYRTELVLGARLVELRLVLKLEEIVQRAPNPQLLVEAAMDRFLHGFSAARMAATAIRPEQGPETLARGALLNQKFPVFIKYQQ